MPLLSKKEYDTSEENYLKAIYHLTIVSNADVSTNSIAEMMETKSLVCDRYAQKLAEKSALYQIPGVFIDDQGKLAAKMIVRKHRFGKSFWWISWIFLG
jgi:DtxR family Mn-dependent transcriptional regulator